MVSKVRVVGVTNVPVEDEDEFCDENSSDQEGVSEYESENENNDFLEAFQSASQKRKLDEDEAIIKTSEEVPPKKKKKKKASTANMKPPTAEEMTRLRETENLFHSNLFRMQIEEMIKEVRPKKTERKQLKLWLDQLQDFLSSKAGFSECQLNQREVPGGIVFPLPELPVEDVKATSMFKKPLSVSVIGSYSAGCCLGPSLEVDVAVIAPKKCLLKEDYLNGRYHKKRASYLCQLAGALAKSELIDKEQGVSWTFKSGDLLKPNLLVRPAGKLNKVKVFVTAMPQTDSFKLSRFTPDKNNIRESWFTRGQMQDSSTATPFYNTSIMQDLVWSANEAIRQQALENNNNLKDAVTLLRVWLRQRHLDQGAGAFTGFLVSMLVVGLLRSRRLNTLMSSYQIIRNVWLAIAQSDWTKEGFSLCNTKQEDSAPSLQDFHRHFDVVFVDATGYCNLAADVHRLTYQRVKHEAQLAVQCLDNPDMNSFHALFMTPMPFLHQFDHVLCIRKGKKVMKNILVTESCEEERVKYFVATDRLWTELVLRLLERGLGGRVEQIAYQLDQPQQWEVGRRPPGSEDRLMIGLRLNTETAYSIIEKGPPANEPQAADFRKLWGSRCELRRFRDGTVCEAVVWAEVDAPLATRRLITRQMVVSLLHDRLGFPKNSFTYLADQLEPLIIEKMYIPEGFAYGTGEEASHSVIQSFDRLAKQLRELPDMPLDIASIQGVSPVFRGTDVFPPLATIGRPQAKAGMRAKTSWILLENMGKAPEYIAPIEIVLQLGLSRKWPEDLDAVRRIRAAFNLHIAKALLKQFDLQTQAFPDYVDVFKDGFVFRLQIVYPREPALLKESTTPDGKLCYRENPESLQLEKYTLHLPKLTGALHGLQQQWPSMGIVSRLAKRWLCSQLLDDFHFPDMATELIVASLFLSPEPFCPLTQPMPMFLRFINLLATRNWHLEPLIVNFNSDLKREDILEIESHFRSERATLPPLFIATQYDKSGSVWTKEAPLLPVLVRVASLAKEALSKLEAALLRSALLNECKVIFRPPLELYDATIKLKPLLLPRLDLGVDFVVTKPPVQLKTPQDRKLLPISGFDPAQCYLRELRESYSDYALFFHDTYGGSTIGVLFKPSAFQKTEFKVSHVNCRKVIKEDKKTVLTLNFDAIIEDFYIIGAGLVRTIDLSQKYSKEL